jgi:hypothetical protein
LFPDDDALAGIERFPRTYSGGLALPPRQLPPPAPRTVAIDETPDAVSRIVTGVTGKVVDAVESVRRALAERGVS